MGAVAALVIASDSVRAARRHSVDRNGPLIARAGSVIWRSGRCSTPVTDRLSAMDCGLVIFYQATQIVPQPWQKGKEIDEGLSKQN